MSESINLNATKDTLILKIKKSLLRCLMTLSDSINTSLIILSIEWTLNAATTPEKSFNISIIFFAFIVSRA